MPLSDYDSIRLTAEGMIRNFGKFAWQEADAVATKMSERGDTRGLKLWRSVCDEVSAMQVMRVTTAQIDDSKLAHSPSSMTT